MKTRILILAVMTLALVGCDWDAYLPPNPGGGGGGNSKGGAVSQGGSASPGGSTSQGGSVAQGGVISTGGTQSTGGSTGSGNGVSCGSDTFPDNSALCPHRGEGCIDDPRDNCVEGVNGAIDCPGVCTPLEIQPNDSFVSCDATKTPSGCKNSASSCQQGVCVTGCNPILAIPNGGCPSGLICIQNKKEVTKSFCVKP